MVFSSLTPAQFRRYSSFHLCPPCPDGGGSFFGANGGGICLVNTKATSGFPDCALYNQIGEIPASITPAPKE